MHALRLPRVYCLLLGCLLLLGSICGALRGYSALSCTHNHLHFISKHITPHQDLHHGHSHHEHSDHTCTAHTEICDHDHDNEITFTDQKLLKQQQLVQNTIGTPVISGCLPWTAALILKPCQQTGTAYQQRAPPLRAQQLRLKQHIELLI